MIFRKKTLEERFQKMLKKSNSTLNIESTMKYLNIDREKAKELLEDFLMN